MVGNFRLVDDDKRTVTVKLIVKNFSSNVPPYDIHIPRADRDNMFLEVVTFGTVRGDDRDLFKSETSWTEAPLRARSVYFQSLK